MALETFFSVSEQAAQFLMSVVLGAAWGIIYDCFRVIRIIFPPARKKAAVDAADVLFVLCCAAALFVFSYVFCRAQVRFFCIFGGLLGFVLYYFTIGSVITGIIRAVAEFVFNVIDKILSVTVRPIMRTVNAFCQKNKLLFVHTYENLKKLRRSCKTYLKKYSEMLYNKKTKKDLSETAPSLVKKQQE